MEVHRLRVRGDSKYPFPQRDCAMRARRGSMPIATHLAEPGATRHARDGPAARAAETGITMKPKACVLLLLTLAGPAAATDEVDWPRVADTDVVEIVTSDEDGALRETKVWIVVLDGHGYVR